ncbi:MAG: LysR family transcriptional regulator [Rhodospirillaceae bacterium]|nr:LysR family transcriptional regulator [Rhodospirillaceae bacterium]
MQGHNIADMGLGLRELRCLLAVGEAGGIGRAARSLGIAQPALTRTLRQLETRIGARLLERHPRGVVPTEAGRSLIARARAIEGELRQARDDLQRLARRGAATATLTVGVMPIAAADLVPRAVTRLLAEQPGLAVHLVEGFNRSLIPALQRREIDAIVGPLADAVPPGIVEEVLYQSSLAVVVRAGHPLAARRKLTFRDLLRYPWALGGDDTGPRRQVEAGFRAEGLPSPETSLTSDSVAALKALAMMSDRICALSRELIEPELGSGALRLLPIRWPARARPIGVSRLESRGDEALLLRFVAALKSALRPARAVAARGPQLHDPSALRRPRGQEK